VPEMKIQHQIPVSCCTGSYFHYFFRRELDKKDYGSYIFSGRKRGSRLWI